MDDNRIWISILEYSVAHKISVSTIRRRIKSHHLDFKEVNGKYYIAAENEYFQTKSVDEKELLNLKLENQRLRSELAKLKEEVLDQSMLNNVLEKELVKRITSQSLPNLPEHHHA